MFSAVASTGVGILAAAGLFPHISSAAATPGDCQALVAAGLSTQIYYPGDANYVAREASFWSTAAPLEPECIVQPRNTAEVCKAIKAIASAGGDFAVRSGGHGVWAGANDVHCGATIDLGLMNATTYDSESNLVSIQPGPNWGAVYSAIEPFGVAVAGGRDAGVGIGGFLTGGGNSFYTGQLGFGCDSVVNYEVVLADGSVVNANASSNPDLWKALKGGSGNFGIVTRFDLKTLPGGPIWGGMRLSVRSTGDQAIAELVNFTNNNQNNPQDAHLVIFTYNPTTFGPDVVLASIIVDTQGVVNASAFDQIQEIPTFSTDLEVRTIGEITEAYSIAAGFRNVWFTLTFKNDARIVTYAAQLHDELVADLQTLIPASDFVTQCLFQPVPTFFADISVAEGGNIFGMDTVKDNSLLWLITGAVSTVENQAIMQTKLANFSATLEAYTISLDANIPWTYLNYADGSQDPLKSYGAANVEFIRDVAAKYDPLGVFQRSTSGFKISRI